MIQLLFTVILSEVFVIMTLLFRTPLRKLVIMTLDHLKRGKGPVVFSTLAGTVLVVLLSSVYGIVQIQERTTEAGVVNPTEEVLMTMALLEATLLGFVLFLALMIDRLHHYIRELRLLRKGMEATRKQNQAFEDRKAAELKALEEEVTTLKEKINTLEPECETKVKMAEAAQAEAEALKKQSEGLLLEYDRLLEDNQNLKNQLESIDQSVSQSDAKKNM